MAKTNHLLALLFFTSSMTTQTNYHYYSQCGQDKYVHETFFKNKTGGFFVDIGAFDGIRISNTYFFEKYLNWNGICVEPIPEVFEKLEKNRDCICIKGCVADFNGIGKFLLVSNIHVLSGLANHYDPRHLNRIDREGGEKEFIEVQCYTLESILNRYGVSHIDYLSIDTEGNELSILKTIDFDKFDIEIIDVENNYNNPDIQNFLEQKGYQLKKKLSVDEIYQKNR